jgi:hypothetical protein
VGPRAGLDAVAKRKILSHCRESNPGRPARSPVAIPTELSRLLFYYITYLKSTSMTCYAINILQCLHICVKDSSIKWSIETRKFVNKEELLSCKLI